MNRWYVYQDIDKERARQDKLHPAFPKELRMAITAEELGEIGKALQDGTGLREELVHLSAVCVRWIEHLDKEEGQ